MVAHELLSQRQQGIQRELERFEGELRELRRLLGHIDSKMAELRQANQRRRAG